MDKIIIIYSLKLVDNLKKIEEIPFGFTKKEESAIQFCKNNHLYRWRLEPIEILETLGDDLYYIHG